MSIILDGSASATFATPLPVAQGGSGGVSAAAALINLQASVPAIDVFLSASQTVTSAVATKIQLNTKVFDLTNAFDAVTNFRFQPLVAGYYQVNTRQRAVATTTFTSANVEIYKNGTIFYRTIEINSGSTTVSGSTIILLNGSTDYLEFFGTVVGTGTITFDAGGSATGLYGPRVSAILVKAT